jgi:hypothetical protein
MSARRKTEQAMKAFLESYYSGLVYTGTRGEIKEHPCVVVIADSGEEMPLGSGNTSLDVTISIQDEIDEAGEPNSTASLTRRLTWCKTRSATTTLKPS